MSDLLGRAYGVAKGYLDAARGRLEEIDARAQEELRRALPRESAERPGASGSHPGASADPLPNLGEGGRGTRPGEGFGQPDDPFARAAAKITAAQERVTAQRQEAERREQTASAPLTPPDPIETAYKIIGVPRGSDYQTVRAAVDQLRARCAPTRFPDGSSEQAEARVILQRVEEASQVLQNAVGPQPGSRFDKLEL